MRSISIVSRRRREAAKAGRLVTFGITPTEPATGYGYIEAGDDLGGGAFAVKRFIEKPNREKAEALLATGGHLWNSGMFMLPVGPFLDELRRLRARRSRCGDPIAGRCQARP